MTVQTFLVLLPPTLFILVALLYCEKLVPDRGGAYWALAFAALFIGAALRTTILPVALAFDVFFPCWLAVGISRFRERQLPIWFWPTFAILIGGAVLRGATNWWQPRVPELPLNILFFCLGAWILLRNDDGPRPRHRLLTAVICLLVPAAAISLALGEKLSPKLVMAWGSLGFMLGLAQVFSLLEVLRHREQRAQAQVVTESRALEEEHLLLRTLVEHAPIGITFSDTQGRIGLVNQRARDYLGLTDQPPGASSGDFLELLRDRSVSRSPLDDLLSKFESTDHDRGVRGTIRLATSTGERTFDTIVTPQKAQANSKLVQMAIMVDTSEQAALEQKLRQSQKMETIATLAAGVAHDFNNQLLVIQANLELVLLEDLPDVVDDLVNSALNSTRHCSQIALDLLSFSRIRLSDRKPLELAPLLQETHSFLRATLPASVDLEVEVHDDSLAVLAAETEMQQIVMNLALNAQDALGDKGAIRIRAEKITGDPGPPFSSEEQAICLVVEDNGPGIPTELRERIFEPFFTTKEVGRGTGLGLATVHSIVTSLGGSIAVENSGEGGTRFKVLLPSGRKTSGRWQAKRASRGGCLPKTVLVVDDEPAIRDILRLWLTRQDCRVLEANDGAEAVSVFLDQPMDIDLVIMDFAMPNMNGLDALLKMRETRPGLRVVLSSGNLSQPRSPIPDDVLCLAKPYPFSDLEELLRDGVNSKADQPSDKTAQPTLHPSSA